jgi:hypothetical protein
VAEFSHRSLAFDILQARRDISWACGAVLPTVQVYRQYPQFLFQVCSQQSWVISLLTVRRGALEILKVLRTIESRQFILLSFLKLRGHNGNNMETMSANKISTNARLTMMPSTTPDDTPPQPCFIQLQPFFILSNAFVCCRT